jgi:hypothetical protein
MVEADPRLRFQSMDEVIGALGRVGERATSAPRRKLLIAGGAAVGLIGLAAVGALVLRDARKPPPPVPAPVRTVQGPALAALEPRIDAVLPTLACSWVSVTTANGPAGITIAGSGVAARPEDVEARVYDALRGAGANVASSDFSAVSPIDATFCPLLDGLRKIRSNGATHLTSAQSRYEIGWMSQGPYAGQKGAQVIVDLSIEGIEGDFAVYAIEKSNEISQIFASRSAFLAAAKDNRAIEKLPGNGHYRLALDGTPSPGWSGIVLVTGRGGFSERLLSDLGSGAGQRRFERAGQANGWKAEMIWYRFVDEMPDPALPPATESPAPVATTSPAPVVTKTPAPVPAKSPAAVRAKPPAPVVTNAPAPDASAAAPAAPEATQPADADR